jgi:hypothetical protein
MKPFDGVESKQETRIEDITTLKEEPLKVEKRED